MRRIGRVLIVLTLFVLSASNVHAVGDGNIDNGGGGMGNSSKENYWTGGDGVRVTVVRASDHAAVSTPIDFTNYHPKVTISFGKVSKISYTKGNSLTPNTNKYICNNPAQALPRIVRTKYVGASIEAIKSYFTDEQIIRSIANLTGFKFETLINGDYKILLEPIAYMTFMGINMAMTATEAALYDQQLSGELRRRMVSLSNKNLPLAMFLEVSDLGYTAWSGSTTTPASDEDIISSLGIGIVRFSETEEPPEVNDSSYTYRVNTEVITAVTVRGGKSDPDNPVTVQFNIGGVIYSVGNVFYPDGESQLAWVKWRTPSVPQTMKINVSVSGNGNSDSGVITARIVDLSRNDPPNPLADDTNDSFSPASIPARPEKIRADWSIWKPWWQENWVDEGHWNSYLWTDSEGKEHTGSTWIENWVDRGWWEFNLDRYYANFSSDMSISCDSKNPTANGRTMKSGYGINEAVTASVSSNQSTAVTYPQNAVSYFPEFQYKTYWRLLEKVQGGTIVKFEFPKNRYSTYKNRTHFTPIWMPDGSYTVNTWVLDSWTPVGMLSMNLTDSLIIKGNLWDDWHIAPLNP